MPISSHALLPWIVEEFQLQQPRTILDLGIGNGLFGALVMNYSDVFFDRKPCLIGVEGWNDYRNPMWKCYSDVFVEKIQDYEIMEKWDMIVMMDVIEHFDLKEGSEQILRFQRALNPGGIFLISTPRVFVKQEPYKGNELEVHKSCWAHTNFEALRFKPVKPPKHSLFGEKMLIYKFKQEDKT